MNAPTSAMDPNDSQSGADDDAVKLDVAGNDIGPAGCGAGELAFSHIWIANTEEGTVSKIDTQTMVELGRYETGGSSPSRTSVDLNGDMAVANRSGGVTKFFATDDRCEDRNGNGVIDTSSGPSDVLPFGYDECLAWFTPTPYATQRPVAWTAGVRDESSCRWSGQQLWSSGAQPSSQGSLVVQRFNGVTGELVDLVPVEYVIVDSFGAYGGAVDSHDNFWFTTRSGPLVRVAFDTLAVDIWDTPFIYGYGITVDALDRPWVSGLSGLARFDPVSETWEEAEVWGHGIQEDREGWMWIATTAQWGNGAQAVNRETLELGPFVELPGTITKGVSVDVFGHVWVVDSVSTAFRIDRTSLAYDAYDGLNFPYTYSDMTGWGLRNVAAPAG